MTGTTSRRKVIGATVIGIALVLGAFVMSDFGAPTYVPAPKDATATLTAKPSREYIPVADTNNDGVEDWREVFVETEDTIVTRDLGSSTPFTVTTVTDQLGVQLMSEMMLARARGIPFDQEQFITETTARVSGVVSDKLYSRRDIIIIPDADNAIRTYGNTIGSSAIRNNANTNTEKISVVYTAIQTNNAALLAELDANIAMYTSLRDEALNTPVPEVYVDAHLALINSYHAMLRSHEDMQKIFTDPIVALMRVNRYEDDRLGVLNSIRLFYNTTEQNRNLFETTDPVWIISPVN